MDRSQTALFPESLDERAGENNGVRIIDTSVDALDLRALGSDGVVREATGRPTDHPTVLLKLSIYGNFNRALSSLGP